MPLAKPMRRQLTHRRQIISDGYQRDDGLWDIEARMTDVKTAPVDNLERGGFVSAGEPFHDISARLTIDATFTIVSADAVIDASPFKNCPAAAKAFGRLVGAQIGPGWHKEAQDRVAGVAGCTHITELLPVLATTAIQSLWPTLGDDVLRVGSRFLLNSCRSWAQDGEVVKRHLPELYQSSKPLESIE